MTILQDVLNKKSILCKERDLTAELYNLWITKMHDFQDDKYKYEMYLKMIDNLEPYANMIKEERIEQGLRDTAKLTALP